MGNILCTESSTTKDRKLDTRLVDFHAVLKKHDENKIRSFLSHDDAKELMLAKDDRGCIALHIACLSQLPKGILLLLLDAADEHRIIARMLEEKTNFGSTCLHILFYFSRGDENPATDSLRLLLEYLRKHTDIKRMLEQKNKYGWTCLHYACDCHLAPDTLRLLLEYLSKYADIKKIIEEKNEEGWTCLHMACANNLSHYSLFLLLEYLTKRGDIKKMLEEKNNGGWTCLHLACAKDLSTGSLNLLFEYFSKHADIKKVLEEKDNNGFTCLHFACYNKLSAESLRLLLDHLFKHVDIKNILEKKSHSRVTCLHFACRCDLSTNSLRLLLEYLSEHADIKKMLEEKCCYLWGCLHFACVNNLSIDSLRLLISFFPSNQSFQLVLASWSFFRTPLDLAKTDEHKELLKDPNCWRKSRYWLLCNYQKTFFNSLYPNSLEKTLEALKELKKNYADDETVKNATLLQQNLVERLRIVHDESAARHALEFATTSATVLFDEDFHRGHIIQRENVDLRQLIANLRKLIFAEASHTLYDDESAARHALEFAALSTTEDFHRDHIMQRDSVEAQQLIADFQRLKPLSEEEFDRQELEKLIFDRLSRDRLIKEAVPILLEHGITKESFFLLNENHLREMGVKIGPRVQLFRIIEQETFRRNNLSARSDLSSRPRSPGHTPRISVIPPISLPASALIQQQHQQPLANAPPLPTTSNESEDNSNTEEQQRSFVATAKNSELVSVNGGSESYHSGPTATS